MSAPIPVFVGGALIGPDPWREQVPRFEGAVVIDLADCPARDDRDRVAWLASRVAMVPRPLALIGHGIGAAAALDVAAGIDPPCDGLVLVGLGASTVPAPTSPRELAAAAFSEAGGPLATRARHGLEDTPPDALARDLATWGRIRSAGRLAFVAGPVLIIAAGRDRLVELSAAEALSEELPGAGLAVLPNAGHALPLEAAGAVDLLVAGFLARLELSLG